MSSNVPTQTSNEMPRVILPERRLTVCHYLIRRGENKNDGDTGYPNVENSIIPRLISTTRNLSLGFRKFHSLFSYYK